MTIAFHYYSPPKPHTYGMSMATLVERSRNLDFLTDNYAYALWRSEIHDLGGKGKGRKASIYIVTNNRGKQV